MYFNEATLPHNPQGLYQSSSNSGEDSEDQDFMSEFFVDSSKLFAKPPVLQKAAVASGESTTTGHVDASSNGQPLFQPGMFYNGTDPYISVPHATRSEMSDDIGPIRRRRTPGMPYTAKNKGRPSRSNYGKSSSDTAALHLQLVSDDGEEILTDHVRRRIMYELSISRISQGQFAEKVLGKTQSTFSGMLNNPKSLRYRGEITYQKIITWINLSCEDRQKVLDGKLVICEPDAEPVGKQQQQPEQVPESVPEQVPEPPKEKDQRTPKARTRFSPQQLSTLQNSFTKNPFPSRGAQNALATQLGLSSDTVYNWFVNTRKRSKKAE